MPLHLHRLTRPASLIAAATLAAGLGGLAPASAGAHARAQHGRAQLESGVTEETPIAPQPPAAGAPPASTPSQPPAAEVPPATGGSGRRARREARRARSEGLATECSVQIQTSTPLLKAGAQLTLTGSVTCAQAASAAGQTVTLFQKIAHTPGFDAASSTTTAADGSFQFAPEALSANSTFYAQAGEAVSNRVKVQVAPKVTITTPLAGAQLLIGSAHAARADVANAGAVTFTGSVSPVDAGAKVSLQREYRRGAWHRIGGGATVDEEGNYSIVHAFSRPGLARIRVVVHSHGLALTSASAPVTYELLRGRHRGVTIQASANPLVFGQSVTITGTVPGAADQTVTLLDETPAHTFAALAEMTATGNEYSFTESPLASTRYRVRTAVSGSGVLSESVGYALVQDPPAASVTVGTPLSFTGTLLPAHEGQPVDLESQDTAGPGYHVIAVGSESSTTSFSIEHSFSSVGTEHLRITVPPGTDLQGVSGEPFTLEVTPAA
jgi:hypothetical protein